MEEKRPIGYAYQPNFLGVENGAKNGPEEVDPLVFNLYIGSCSAETPREPAPLSDSCLSIPKLEEVVKTLIFDPGYGETLEQSKSAGASEWTSHKLMAQELASIIRFYQFTDKNGEKSSGWKLGGLIDRCATYKWVMECIETGERKSYSEATCKKRYCPMCAWLKQKQRWFRALHNLPILTEGQGRLRYRLLTLTVKNVPFSELLSTYRKMLTALSSMVRRKEWDAVGWLRSVEITYKKYDKTYHPHIHIWMASPWENPRTETREWVQIWKEVMRLDYDPVCYIEQCHGKDPALEGLSEAMKYVFKPADLLKSPMALISAFEALGHARMLFGGGIFKKLFQEVEVAEEDFKTWKSYGRFAWRAEQGVYRKELLG